MMINSREAVREAVIRGLGIAPVAESEFIPDKRLHTVRVSKRRIQRQRISAFLDLVEEVNSKKKAGSKAKARA